MEALRNAYALSLDLTRPEPRISEKNLPDLTGKVYIVTGASSGIGFETARLLLQGGATVWVFGRTPSRLEQSLEALRTEFPAGKVHGVLVDNEDLATVKPAAEEFLGSETRLDGIVHNAGKNWLGENRKLIRGYDDVLVANVLGPFLLQKFLDEILIKTAKSSPPNSVRIVWVASTSHYLSPENGGINWDDLNDVVNGLFGFGVYGQTKAFNIYQAIQWDKKHPNSGVVSISTHPGVITSDIRRARPDRAARMASFCRPTIYGAYAEVQPLLSDKITTADNGQYYVPFERKGRVRPDVLEAAHGPRGEKAWKWMEDETKEFA